MRLRQWMLLVGIMMGLWMEESWADEFDLRTLRSSDAVLHLAAADTYDGHGQIIRCGVDQRVGVWLDGDEAMTLRHVTIDGCLVGIVSAGAGHVIEHVTITKTATCSAGIIGGMNADGTSGSEIADNWVSGCDYGIVWYGLKALIKGNTISQNIKDGLLIIGDYNTIESNQVTQSGRYGLNVISSVPNIANGVFLSIFRNPAYQNTIRSNVVSGSGLYDLRQWPASTTCTNLGNSWSVNTATKRSPSCLQ